MDKRMKQPAGLARKAKSVAFALSLAVAALMANAAWDGQSWVYTPETHTTIAPTAGEGTAAGLDAKARGFKDSADITVDKWYWTMDESNAYSVDFTPPGGMIIIR